MSSLPKLLLKSFKEGVLNFKDREIISSTKRKSISHFNSPFAVEIWSKIYTYCASHQCKEEEFSVLPHWAWQHQFAIE